MQKLLLNMHIFMHSKIQKYAKNSLLCVKKKMNILKQLKNILCKKNRLNKLDKCKINKIITKNVILILERVPTGGYEMSFYIFKFEISTVVT
jgi:hypothetical protein